MAPQKSERRFAVMLKRVNANPEFANLVDNLRRISEPQNFSLFFLMLKLEKSRDATADKFLN